LGGAGTPRGPELPAVADGADGAAALEVVDAVAVPPPGVGSFFEPDGLEEGAAGSAFGAAAAAA
jgi:hypothetical protein